MPHPALHVSERLHAIIVGNLLPLIMQQILVLGAYTIPVWARISRARQRLTRLLANFAAGVFRVERTHSRNGDGGTKTDGSRRTIPMVPQVRAAFETQRTRAVDGCPWVFHSQYGNPMDAVNFTNRIWYPLLRNLGLVGTPDGTLFGEGSSTQALICERDGQAIGFAVYFFSYSTWLGTQGIYLEDLYVTPQARGTGAGKALLRHLAQEACAKGCGRLEWSVLDWNEPAIQFYKSIGAQPQDEWVRYRMEGETLRTFAQG